MANVIDAYTQDPKSLEIEDELLTTIKWSMKEDKIAVLVEGDLDYTFYSCIIRSDKDGPCFIYPVKDNVNTKGKIMSILRDISSGRAKAPGKGLVGMVDSDFMGIDRPLPRQKNLFFIHTHDIETALMSAGTMDRWINGLKQQKAIDQSKIKLNITEPWVEKFVQILVQQTFFLGLVKYYLEKNGLRDIKRGIRTADFFDREKLEIISDRIISEISKQMPRKSGMKLEMVKDDLFFDIENIKGTNLPKWNIINGHDAEDILQISLIPIIVGDIRINRRKIESSLLEHLEFEHVHSFPIYKELLDWQNSNSVSIMVQDKPEFIARKNDALLDYSI